MTMRTMYARFALCLSLGCLALTTAGLSPAQAAPKRLGVMTFRGPGEGATRNVVMKTGKANRYQLVGGAQIGKTASRLKVTLDSDDAFSSVARELGIAAFVTGEVSKKKATLTVRNGADGSVTAEASWAGPNPRKLSVAVAKTFWKRLGPAIERGKAPSGAKQAPVAEETAPEAAADDSSDDDKDKDKGGGLGGGMSSGSSSSKKVASSDEEDTKKSSKKKKDSDSDSGSDTVVSAKSEPSEPVSPTDEAVIVFAGPRVMSRSLTYKDDIYGRNSKYSLGAAPELVIGGEIYPAAYYMGGWATNIGLTGDLAYMLPVVTSKAADGTYKTYQLNWAIGAKVRLPYGLYGTVGYGDQNYQLIKPAGGTLIDVPKVDYRYVRIGAGVRTHLTNEWTLMVNLAYLQCLSFGQIHTSAYFPHTKGAAVEVGAGIGYRLTRLFELQAGAEIRRYGLSFNVPLAEYQANNNVRVAGGATDQYLMGWAGVAVILGTEKGPRSHDEEAEPASSKSSDDEKGKDEEDEEKK